MTKQFNQVTLPIALVLIIAGAWLSNAGPLTPPAGAITSTGRFGPRTDVATLAGSASALHVINVPGSYYLSGNITGVVAKNGIEITVAGVTLDLNGFALIGVVGSFDGINSSGTRESVVITNGHVRSWGRDGVDVSIQVGRIERVTAANNGGWGIACTNGTTTQIVSCEVFNNGDLVAFTGGIFGGSFCLIRDCVARLNTGDGILAGTASTVRGCATFDNTGDGIEVGSDCVVTDNTCDSDGAGVHVTQNSNRIEGNHVTDADRGIDIDGTGNLIIHNTASGNTDHYDIGAGNDVGPIQAAATSTSPWANIAF